MNTKPNRQTKKINAAKKGGDGGEIFIFGKTITGEGKISAEGGDGGIGGDGGKVTLVSDNIQFSGKISAKGGASSSKAKWWENTWIQLIFLISAIAGIVSFILYLYAK